MGILLKKKRHLYTRIPLGLLIIGFIAICPIIISILGSWISELVTKEPCHEGNCSWATIGWFFFFTFPLAGFLFFVFLIIVIVDVVKMTTTGRND